MTIKEKKTFLYRYRFLKDEERSIREEIAMLRASKMSASANVGDGMPHSHEPKGLEEYAARLDTLERKLSSVLWRVVNQQITIEIAINALQDPRERTLMRQRYLNLKDWTEVADCIGYSRRQTLYLHGAALKHLDGITDLEKGDNNA